MTSSVLALNCRLRVGQVDVGDLVMRQYHFDRACAVYSQDTIDVLKSFFYGIFVAFFFFLSAILGVFSV